MKATVYRLTLLAERDGGLRCVWCNRDLELWEHVDIHALPKEERGRTIARAATLEHVIPACKDGSRVLDNLMIGCRDCNSSRGHRTIQEAVAFFVDRGQDVQHLVVWAGNARAFKNPLSYRKQIKNQGTCKKCSRIMPLDLVTKNAIPHLHKCGEWGREVTPESYSGDDTLNRTEGEL
jgi:hypothetical protein